MSNGNTMTRRGANSQGVGVILRSRIALLVFVGALLVFGLVMLYSSSSVVSYYESGDSSALFVKQLVFVVIGVILCLIVALIPYQIIVQRLSKYAWAASVVLLLATFFLGVTGLGATRWIELGPMQLQPSEFAKIAIIILLVQLIDNLHDQGSSKSLIIAMLVAVFVPIGLIILEPDLGTTIIATVGVLAVLWFGGIPKKLIALIVGAGVILAVFFVFMESFRQSRLSSFLDPWADPMGSGYQILNSYYAFGEGGFIGVGIGMSKQKFSYLPLAQNDFIFAIVGEELGLVGALLVIVLFLGFLYAAFKIACNAPDRRGTMLAGAAAAIIGFQAFLNMLCVVGALPVTGKPLPFFSAGGTSMLSTMILVGLILSVSMQSKQLSVHEQRREQLLIIEGGSSHNKSSSQKSANAPAANAANAVFSLPLITSKAKPGNTAQKVVPISRVKAAAKLPTIQNSKYTNRTSSNNAINSSSIKGASNSLSRNANRSIGGPSKGASSGNVGNRNTSAAYSSNRPAYSKQAQPALSLAALRRNRTGLVNNYSSPAEVSSSSGKRQRRQGGAA